MRRSRGERSSRTSRKARVVLLDDLLPDHASTLARTDPDLVEVFDNWAFDEVLIGVITQLLPFIGSPRTLNATRVIDEGTRA